MSVVVEWIVPILALFAVLLYFGVRYMGLKLRRSSTAEAEFVSITPFFRKQGSLKTHWLTCTYVFRAGQKDYGGRLVLPLSYFLESSEFSGGLILNDTRIDLPVLILDSMRLVGEESIEHFLLHSKASIPVRYLVRDPRRNGLADSEVFEVHRVRDGKKGL